MADTEKIPARTYRIVIGCTLGALFQEAFAGMSIAQLGDGLTSLTATLDQAELAGVIDRVQSLALDLVEITSNAPPSHDW